MRQDLADEKRILDAVVRLSAIIQDAPSSSGSSEHASESQLNDYQRIVSIYTLIPLAYCETLWLLLGFRHAHEYRVVRVHDNVAPQVSCTH